MLSGVNQQFFQRLFPGWRTAATVLLVFGWLLAGGCQTAPLLQAGAVYPCHGAAQVIRVSPWTYSALVRYKGRPVVAWWDEYSVLLADGQRTRTLVAKPGQMLHFDGLLTDRDLYFGREWTGPPPSAFHGISPRIQETPWPAGVPKPKKPAAKPLLPKPTVTTVGEN